MILSIETSTKVCSVALHNQGELIAESNVYVDKSHSEKLSILIKEILSNANIDAGNLSSIAVASGPGSYTGLRIGVSAAKGLCYALKIPLIAISTLEAMALGATRYNTEKLLYCPMIDARRMEVYCLLADRKLNFILPPTAKIIDEQSFSDVLSENKVVFFGNGANKCKPALSNNPNAIFLNVQGISAANIGELAWKKFEQQDFEDLAYFEPDYLKEFHAIKPKKLFV